MGSALAISLAIGTVFDIAAARNTSLTFFVLWVMTKQLEVDWRQRAIIVAFLNFGLLFILALFLSHNTSFILSMFSPDGMYLVLPD